MPFRTMAAIGAMGAACLGTLLGIAPRPSTRPALMASVPSFPPLVGWSALLGGCYCLTLARRTWRDLYL